MRNCIFLLILLFAVACGEKNNRLEVALALAGDNRGELEKVLNHYSRSKADSLKLRAAVFLIANMPGHVSYIPEEITKFREEYERILFTWELSLKQKKEHLQALLSKYYLEPYIVEDAEIITADYLIDNIDRSFEMWENIPHCRHLGFDDFCEFILPYKCVDLQELDNWKEYLAGQFNKMHRVLHDDQSYPNPYNAATILTEDIRYTNGVHNFVDWADYSGYVLYNKNTIANKKFGQCTDYAVASVAIMRSKGIPACLEQLPQWADGASGHAWFSILNDNGRIMPSPWGWESTPGDLFFPIQKMAKVFRETYAANTFREEYGEKSLLKLPEFHKFQKDVTDLYVRTSDLVIPVKDKRVKEKYAYLAIFNNTDWHVVDLGEIKRGKAHFRKIGQGIACMVLGYDGEKLVPISTPFILETSGIIRYCIPQPEMIDSVKLTRKFHRTVAVATAENGVVGGQIEASNRPDFSDADTLFVIHDLEYPDLIPLGAEKRYRYWRYRQGAPKKRCSLAELQFYAPGSPEEPAMGTIIGSEKEMKYLSTVEKIFDGDWLTFYTSQHWSHGWIGLDFGKPVAMERVRIVPRSDDNGIHYGDRYELKYWNDEWVSLGEQVAKERYLLFDGVPKGALLLLSNHTRGKQERIFTLEDGRVRWW